MYQNLDVLLCTYAIVRDNLMTVNNGIDQKKYFNKNLSPLRNLIKLPLSEIL